MLRLRCWREQDGSEAELLPNFGNRMEIDQAGLAHPQLSRLVTGGVL